MGYYKKKLQEDIELHPESYNEDQSEYMTDIQLKQQMSIRLQTRITCKHNNDVMITCNDCDEEVNLKMDGSAVKESFEKEKK